MDEEQQKEIISWVLIFILNLLFIAQLVTLYINRPNTKEVIVMEQGLPKAGRNQGREIR